MHTPFSLSLASSIHPIEVEPARLVAIAEAIGEYPDRCIRLRLDRASLVYPAATHVVPWYPAGRWLDDAEQRPSQSLGFPAGDYYIQDAGSMLALALLQVQPQDHICDLCAAPGGKASGILEQLRDGGFLLANEPIRTRHEALEWSLARTGNPRYATTQVDPEPLSQRCQARFDAVLVDAPCSGQTLVGKGKREVNAFSPPQIAHSALRQQRILDAAIRMLRVGGRLIYSTCTFATAENEEQVRRLIETYPGCWEPIELASLAPWKSPIQPGCYRLWPDRDRCAGAFAAGLQLVAPLPIATAPMPPEPERYRGPKGRRDRVQKSKPLSLDELGKVGDLFLIENGEVLQGVASDLQEVVADPCFADSSLRLHWPVLGRSHKQLLAPEFALGCLDARWFEPANAIELTDEEAILMVGGASLNMPAERLARGKTGWSMATWRGKPLGWMKGAGGHERLNNHLPKFARIAIA